MGPGSERCESTKPQLCLPEEFLEPTVLPSIRRATSGLAMERQGQGRVWKIAPGGGACEDAANPYQGCEEVFRIQPME